MPKIKIKIIIEIIKVSLLVFFLYIAFKDANFPDAFWKPVQGLLKVGLILLAYFLGRHFATTYEEGWENYLLVLYSIGVLTLIAWAGLGSHVENADPLFGGGEEVIDFIPKPGERSDHAINIFITFLIPAIYGVYKKRKTLDCAIGKDWLDKNAG
jgi:hypothetical protein